MNFKFPEREKFKIRYCYKCNKQIDFGEFYIKNFKAISEEKLIYLWQNEHLKYFCCFCYNQLM